MITDHVYQAVKYKSSIDAAQQIIAKEGVKYNIIANVIAPIGMYPLYLAQLCEPFLTEI